MQGADVIKSKWVKGGFLILLSVLLLSTGFWIAGTDKVLHDLKQFPAWVVVGVLTAFALNLAVVSFRLGRLLKYFGVTVPHGIATKASLQGHFASLFLISLFGQVAGRQAVLRRYGTPSVFVASLTAIERAVLFVVSGGFCFLGSARLLDVSKVAAFFDKISFTQMFLATALCLLASLWFCRSGFETQLLTGMRSKQSIGRFFEITAITFVTQVLVLGAFVIAGLGLAPEIGFWNYLAAAAITSFAASLPISVNGWGVRELTAVFAFGHIGMPPSSALAISILVGLCSTAVILAEFPYALSRHGAVAGEDLHLSGNATLGRLPIEKIATWGLVIAGTVLTFFQIHLPLHGGVINLNFADAFAVLALASVATHAFFSRSLPVWSVPKFNLLLVAVGLLLLFSFLHGVQVIGVTQWALAGRLLGWLILLGYLSMGVLAVSYLGKLGIRRFIETLVASAVVIVLFQAIIRWLAYSGWIDPSAVTLKLEGYSGNRNSFAFQLLTCSVLLIAYFRYLSKSASQVRLGPFGGQRDIFLAAGHGAILAGVVLSGSRAGILTGIILLAFAGLAGFANRRMLLRSLIFGILIWLIFAWLLPWGSQLFAEQVVSHLEVQSVFFDERSDPERWGTILRGFEMWRDAPWFGAGLGVFIEMSSQWFKQPIVIHSTPVWILAEFGILGAAALSAALIWILVSVARAGFTKPQNRAVIMLLGVFAIFGLVHEIFYQRIFWLGLGFCIALPFHARPSASGRVRH